MDNFDAPKKLVLIRTLAFEGLWMVTREKTWHGVSLARCRHARRLQFAIADGGSRASFDSWHGSTGWLRAASNIEIVDNATTAIERVASEQPTSASLSIRRTGQFEHQLLQERKLRPCRCQSRADRRARVEHAGVSGGELQPQRMSAFAAARSPRPLHAGLIITARRSDRRSREADTSVPCSA